MPSGFVPAGIAPSPAQFIPPQFAQQQVQRQFLPKPAQPLPEPVAPINPVEIKHQPESPIPTNGQPEGLQTTTPSAPETPATPSTPVDKNVDLDGDGVLSLAEVQYAAFVHHGLSSSVVEALFNQVDKNRDGYLNGNEFNDIRPLILAKSENAALRYLQVNN